MTGRCIGLRFRKYRRPAARHHAAFRALAGNDQIASPFALTALMALLEYLQPVRALEVGAGIGTMTSLLTNFGCQTHAVEDNAFCATQLRKNLEGWAEYRLSEGLGYLHHLIVVDGDQVKPNIALGLLALGGWMLVEGNRREWRAGLQHGYRDFVAVNLRPFDRSKGVWLLAFEPTPLLCLAFALERGWQRVLGLTSRAWSLLTGATQYQGKRRVYDAVAR